MSSIDTDDIARDRIRGVKKNAEFLGEPERRVSYLIERGVIPTGREGSAIIASKARLRVYHRQLTDGETAQFSKTADQ
jgi:hypothetical protein